MIKTFKDKEAQKIFNRNRSRKLPQNIQRNAMRKLWMIDAADNLNDLRVPPANHLEKLRGDRAGQHSIRINKQWMICFNWKSSNVYNVEIVDYHD